MTYLIPYSRCFIPPIAFPSDERRRRITISERRVNCAIIKMTLFGGLKRAPTKSPLLLTSARTLLFLFLTCISFLHIQVGGGKERMFNF